MVGPWFTTPWRLVSQSHGAVAWCFRSLCPSHVPFPLPHPGTDPFPASHGLATPSGPCAALATRPSPPRPLVPSSRVHTPPVRLQPCGAGPLDPLQSADRFVHPARVAPFPPPSLSPVPQPRPNPLGCCAGFLAYPVPKACMHLLGTRVPRRLGVARSASGPLNPHPSGVRFVRLARVAPFPPFSPLPRPWPNPLGCCVAPSHPSSRVYTPPGRQQPCGAGPLDPHPSGNRFVRLARVPPLPPPPLTPVPPPMLS